MRIRILLLSTLLTLGGTALAQRDRLSVGVNLGDQEDFLDLGGAIGFQHRLASHWELLGDLSAVRSVFVGTRTEGMTVKNGTNAFVGIGIGYVGRSDDRRGFHAGLLVGGLLYPVVRNYGGPNLMLTSPALGITAGHSVGARCDVALEYIRGERSYGTQQGFTALRFSYQLFGWGK